MSEKLPTDKTPKYPDEQTERTFKSTQPTPSGLQRLNAKKGQDMPPNPFAQRITE